MDQDEHGSGRRGPREWSAARWQLRSAPREVTTVALAGDLDIARRAELELCISICASATGHVALDLHDVTFLDASGIGQIMAMAAVTRRRGRRLFVRGASARVACVLRAAGVAAVLEVDPSPRAVGSRA